MSRKLLLEVALRLCVGWAVLTATVAAWHTEILMQAGDLIGHLVEQIMPGQLVRLSIGQPGAGGGDVAISITATRPILIDVSHSVTPWMAVHESINSVHDLMPLILLGGLLLAWPFSTWARRGVVTGVGGAIGVAVTLWITSVHIAGLYELSLQRVAAADREPRAAPWFLTQMLFFEGGGLWAVPIALGLVLCLAMTHGRRTRTGAAATRTNFPA